MRYQPGLLIPSAAAVATAPSLVGSILSGVGGNATVTVNFTALQNDVVYAWGGHGQNANIVTTSGYTKLFDHVNTAAFSLFRKVMGSTPDASVTFNASGHVGQPAVWHVAVVRGANITTPEDVTPTMDPSGGSSVPDSPSITTVTGNTLVFAIAQLDTTTVGATVPSGYNNFLRTVHTTTFNKQVLSATRVVATAGVEDPPAFGSTSLGSWQSATFAVRPA